MYREFASKAPGVLCTWERSGDGHGSTQIIPDGCVDIVWFRDGRIEVAGPDTGSRSVSVDPQDIVGLRFAPAMARGFLGVPVGALLDDQPLLRDLGARSLPVARRLEAQMTQSTRERRQVLEGEVTQAALRFDDLTRTSIGLIRREPRIRVGALAAELGVSVRQLHRRFVEEVGYGPKFFARVVRLRRFLAVVERERDLSIASFMAGYASQSHMSDEVRELTSLTAVRFVEAWGGGKNLASGA
ncbi:MAG: helix-turn-helix domain-containing protein [Microbacterium enclense]